MGSPLGASRGYSFKGQREFLLRSNRFASASRAAAVASIVANAVAVARALAAHAGLVPHEPDVQPIVLGGAVRTYADPRLIDLTLDANDRAPGGTRGDPRTVNYGPNGLARFNTLTSWLSQWSSRSRAGGPENLARTTVPVLQVEYTADQSTFPSDAAAWSKAAQGRETFHRLVGATHYLRGQDRLLGELYDCLRAWVFSL